MKVTKHLFTLMALVSVAGFGQAVGDPVIGDGAGSLPAVVNVPAPVTPPGDPTTGDYSILVNAYIQSYARVVVYDNWINFSSVNMTPTTGTWLLPVRQVANGNPNGWYPVDGSSAYDLAGGAVETNCRLNMSIDMEGHLTRVKDDGTPFAGVDTRRADGGKYQLATMYKINFHGRFLDGALGGPAEDASGTQYPSPTSAVATQYNTWTGWNSTGGSGDVAVAGNDTGWLWPDDSLFAWTGAAYAGLTNSGFDPSGFGTLRTMNLVIERGQAQADLSQGTDANLPDSNRAEWWIAESVIRRGLQDVSGNYRQNIKILLSYRETPAAWAP